MFGGFLVPGSSIRSVGLTARRFLGTSTPRFPRFKGDPPLPWENYEKNNFKNIHLYNKRHLKVHKKALFRRNFEKPNPQFADIPVHKYGCRGTGIRHPASWEPVPEMVPELVVPDLSEFDLKPYVSYRTKEIYQEELTSADLFNAIYGKEIMRRFHERQKSAGDSKEGGAGKSLMEEEINMIEDPEVKARQTGSDLFKGGAPTSRLWDVRWQRVK